MKILLRRACTEMLGRLCPIALAAGVCGVLAANCAPSRNRPQGPAEQLNELHRLWALTMDPRLQRNVQSDGEAYNMGQLLMVPMYAAFRRGDVGWEQSFSDYFARLVNNPLVKRFGILSRLQYLYLASEFTIVAKQNGREDLIPAALPDLLFTQVRTSWQVEPAWQWNSQPFPGGAHERVLWKLNNHQVEKSYYGAITDDDLFLFAIAADLKAYGGTLAQQRAWNPVLEDILSSVYKTFSQEVVPQPGGGWLFQPGVWTDHPEFSYAGNREARPGIQPVPVPGISGDSSHAHRFPLWLTSYMRAYPVNSERYRFYLDLRVGLEKQFFNRVLVRPTSEFPCFRTNNYMDGHNGVYRWSYESLGKENGYGPYGLSGTPLLGYWVFLDTDRARGLYRDLAAQFPWPKQCVELYLGPTSHPASASDPQSSTMQLWHILVQLASEL